MFTLLSSAPASVGDTPRRPNILLLLADNWAWPHAGICGDKSVKTPTFDRLAREGVLFTHAFCQVPSCSPARAVLLTGQASHRLEDAASLWGKFPESLATYPALLKEAGYVTGYTIKGWGPGLFRGKRHKQLNPAGESFESFHEFLTQVPEDKPFCFWFGSHDPHQPWDRGADFRGDLDAAKVHVPAYLPDHPVVRKTIVDYYAEVQRFDYESHEILELLRSKRQLDNTVVVMVGDNGWQTPRGLANVYDAGTRVPMAVRWPGHVASGQTCDEFISFEDFAPTFLSAAGLPIPDVMTGRSFLPLVGASGSNDLVWRDAIFLERERHANVRAGDRSYPCRAVRTKQYLYVRNLAPELWPAGDPQTHHAVGPFGDVDNTPFKELILSNRDEPAMRRFFELGFGKRPAEELYALESDPDQIHNVAAEAKYAPVIAKLSKKLAEWMHETEDPRSRNAADPRFDQYPYYGRGLSVHAAEERWLSKSGYGLMFHYECFTNHSSEAFNQAIDSFDVPEWADQVASTGAGHVIFAIGQNWGKYCAPNRAYERLLGVEPGVWTSKRDLILEIGEELKKRDIKLIIYMTARAPMRYYRIIKATGDAVPTINGKDAGPDVDPMSHPRKVPGFVRSEHQRPPVTFLKNWGDVCGEWSMRYRDLVAGWWFDGYKTIMQDSYESLQSEPYNIDTWIAAVRSGNPKAELAFNAGAYPGDALCADGKLCPHQTFTAGEAHGFIRHGKKNIKQVLTPNSFPAPEGVIWHLLFPLSDGWGAGEQPKAEYTTKYLINGIDTINAQGGTVTLDTPCKADGTIPADVLKRLQQLGKVKRHRDWQGISEGDAQARPVERWGIVDQPTSAVPAVILQRRFHAHIAAHWRPVDVRSISIPASEWH